MFGPNYKKAGSKMPTHGAFRPIANEHDAVRTDSSMMSVAGGIAIGRGEDDQLSKEYIYRRMEQKQRMNINKFSDSHQSKNKLMNFYQKQMGGVYDAKQLSKMYGIYQDGEAKMFETTRPMNMQKGDLVYNNLIGEIGILQENQNRGEDCILVFQDRSIRVKKDTHGWSKKLITTDDAAPVAASSAQGPAMFKEQVEGPQKDFINNTMKKIIKEVDSQDDPHIPKDDHVELMKGMSVEKEHVDVAEKIWKHEIKPSEAPKAIAKDHLEENEHYYHEFDPKKKGKEFLIKQDDETGSDDLYNNDDSDEEDDDFDDEEEENVETADDTPIGSFSHYPKQTLAVEPHPDRFHKSSFGGNFQGVMSNLAAEHKFEPGSKVSVLPKEHYNESMKNIPTQSYKIGNQEKSMPVGFHGTYTGKALGSMKVNAATGKTKPSVPFKYDKNVEKMDTNLAHFEYYHGKDVKHHEFEHEGKKFIASVIKSGMSSSELHPETRLQKHLAVNKEGAVDKLDIPLHEHYGNIRQKHLGKKMEYIMKTDKPSPIKLSEFDETIGHYDTAIKNIKEGNLPASIKTTAGPAKPFAQHIHEQNIELQKDREARGMSPGDKQPHPQSGMTGAKLTAWGKGMNLGTRSEQQERVKLNKSEHIGVHYSGEGEKQKSLDLQKDWNTIRAANPKEVTFEHKGKKYVSSLDDIPIHTKGDMNIQNIMYSKMNTSNVGHEAVSSLMKQFKSDEEGVSLKKSDFLASRGRKSNIERVNESPQGKFQIGFKDTGAKQRWLNRQAVRVDEGKKPLAPRERQPIGTGRAGSIGLGKQALGTMPGFDAEEAQRRAGENRGGGAIGERIASLTSNMGPRAPGEQRQRIFGLDAKKKAKEKSSGETMGEVEKSAKINENPETKDLMKEMMKD